MYEYRIYVNSGSSWIRELCLVESGINVRAFHLPAGPIYMYSRNLLLFRYLPPQTSPWVFRGFSGVQPPVTLHQNYTTALFL